ncbi:hypothetical protein AB0F46_41335 [Streptomyces sp. NPDC026665]|uniref:hypothetical protein n=1 Tax=Streptomyces sp. NPDC026665 TaxID=3154798 RepID=UPI0033D40064
MIRNTTEAMKDPGERMMFLAASTGAGGPGQAIEEQERAGQAQLLASEQLPTDLNSDNQADFEALGFVFGDVTPGDPLFRSATLPNDWKRERSDHAMWSYIVDEHGRRRVRVFYQAAYYDRSAHMNLDTVYDYVGDCASTGKNVITDDTWATPSAVLTAARQHAEQYSRWEQRDLENDPSSEWTAAREACEALVAHFEGATEA